MSKSIDFFERQFQSQSLLGEQALNPFEAAALPYLHGEVLDFGCGLGNLALAAARRGCSLLALDASPSAIQQLQQRAAEEAQPILTVEADLRNYSIYRQFDSVVAIGLLMFFDCDTARRQLDALLAATRPGGLQSSTS